MSRAIAVLIVSCPCALALAAPAAWQASALALARQGLLARSTLTIERLAEVEHWVFDKTGTLTDGDLEVIEIVWQGGNERERDTSLARLHALAAASCHPVARAVERATRAFASDSATAAVTAIVEVSGAGVKAQATSDGAPLRFGHAEFCGVSIDTPDSSTRHVIWRDGDRLRAVISLREGLKPQAHACIAALQSQGGLHQVSLMSGDGDRATAQLATSLGFAPGSWRGHCLPEDKLEHVRSLQGAGLCVVMVGDGINDSPAMAHADVSMAPANAANLTQVKADWLLLTPDLSVLPLAWKASRKARRVVRENWLWASLYNGVAIPLAAIGHLSPGWAAFGMAASSAIVLLNAARLRNPR
jgi:P-type Cu2+ transporter